MNAISLQYFMAFWSEMRLGIEVIFVGIIMTFHMTDTFPTKWIRNFVKGSGVIIILATIAVLLRECYKFSK
jgi:hypothetical protein